MNNRYLLTTAMLFLLRVAAFGQVPPMFNYQALALDASVKPITDYNLTVKIGFLSSLEPEFLLWEESHEVRTNSFGMFSLMAGDPVAVKSGGSLGSFPEIQWENPPIWMRTEIRYEGEWHLMGVSSLVSVPYSLVTGKALSGTTGFSITGTHTLPEEPLFEVKRKDGITVFAVYNSGARVNVPMFEEGKASKGGFAIGGFDLSKKLVQDYMLISPDSVRIYIDDIAPEKAVKGGFAIGGFDVAKSGVGEYIRIMPDSTRIYVREGSKAMKGGFAIGSFDESKSTPVEFLNVTPMNYFIGHESGLKNISGLHNSFLGYQSGRELTEGEFNVFIGHKSGLSNSDGSYNVFIGNGSGMNSTSAFYGTFAGHNSGYYNTGFFNSYFGCNSGFATIAGASNTFIGVNAGRLFEKGSSNTFVGTDAGEGGPGDVYDHSTLLYGDNNTALGFQAGNLITGGDNNVYIGSKSGSANESGSGNVFIGFESGASETGSNKLYIANANTAAPLLYGDFATGRLGIGTKTLSEKLNVAGGASFSGTIVAASLTGNVTGDVTGNLAGNVTGNLTGNVSGDVTGNLTGNVTGRVNGISMGRFFLTETGNMAVIESLGVALRWYSDNSKMVIANPSDREISFWYRIVRGTETETISGLIGPSIIYQINDTNIDNAGFEIHFGSLVDESGWCSVWAQYFNKILTGHYMK